jgi:HSP20 family protein
MKGLVPWIDMRRELERFFERFPEPMFGSPEAGGEWAPKVDVSETKDAVTVKAEVPGVEAGDISLSLQGELLTIKGEKTAAKEDKDERYHRKERSYGAFLRAVRLPSAVEASKATASFKNGVLVVTVPKSPAAKGTSIPIKGE